MASSSKANVALNKARFDQEAAQWDSPDHRKTAQEAADAIKAYMKSVQPDDDVRRSNWEVLEIGCGTGLLSTELAPGVKHLLGVDISEGMINAFNAKKATHPNIDAVQILLTSPDQLRDRPHPQRFDMIVSLLTLHHIPDMTDLFNLCAKLLKPNGVVAMADFEDFGPDAILFHPESKRPGVERHGIKRSEIRQVLEATGFKRVTVDQAFSLRKKVDEREHPMEFPFLLIAATAN